MIAAFDPGTRNFGVAFGRPKDAGPTSLVWRLPGADDLSLDRTLAIASSSVTELFALIRPTDVVIESPIIIADRSAHTMAALMQLTGAVRAAASSAGARVHMVASSTVRRHFVGSGRPENPKQAVMDRCRMLNWVIESNDAADAAACWSWGVGHLRQGAVAHTPLLARGSA